MKTNDLIFFIFIMCLAMFVAQANNEKMTTIYLVFIGSIIVFYIIRIVLLCMKDVYLFRYLILFVGAVLMGGIGIFIIPYVASWMQSLPH